MSISDMTAWSWEEEFSQGISLRFRQQKHLWRG